MAGGIKLRWNDKNVGVEKYRIYRSTSPMDPEALPAPIAELAGDATYYNDYDVVEGSTYYYRNEAVKLGKTSLSSEIWLNVTPHPGPITFIGGDDTAGFYGETTTADLISGDELASLVGLSGGTSQFSTEPWLKFSLDGKVLFVAKKPYRHTISWEALNDANVITGNTTVVIEDRTYKVRLLTGGDGDPAYHAGGEWNKLIYRIHVDIPDEQIGNNWFNYTDADIGFGSGLESGSWCQELDGNHGTYRVLRGYDGSLTSYPGAQRSGGHYWRPVLELVS